MTKKPAPFNNPFGALKLPAKAAPAKQPVPPPPPRASRAQAPDDDAALFREAVGEVGVVRAGKQRVGPPPPRAAEQAAARGEEAESLARLAELVSGPADFDLAPADQRLEGWVQGLDPTVLKRLRGGDYPPRAELDLHGLARAEARAALERFLTQSRVQGHRCVLVVTGRGLHSEGGQPVLKEELPGWLGSGRLARQVLAYTSAPQGLGGAGAVLVLLRR